MIFLKIVLEIIAAVIVIIEQFRAEKRYRRILLLLAALVLIGSAVYTWVDYDVSKKSDRERKADLMLIQKLSSSFMNLCFEFDLVDVDSASSIDINFQIATCVNTALSSTGFFADYIRIGHSADSGWFFIDKEKKRLRFSFKNFAVSAGQNTTRVGWQPNDLSDLGHLHLGLFASPLKKEDIFAPYDKEWCPIGKVSIYANTFEAENLLTVAERKPKKPESKIVEWYTFIPKGDTLFSYVGCDFALEPIRLREAIIGIIK